MVGAQLITISQSCGYQPGDFVIKLCETLLKGQNFKMYFDNWFAFLELQLLLKSWNIWPVGTIRSNRLRWCSMKSENELKKGQGIEQLQNDLHNLYQTQWSCDWQMLFNVEKCKVLNFGYNNEDSKCYTLGPNVIKAGDNEKDLGIIVHQSLKSTSQCTEAVKSANKTLGIINRTFMYKDKNTTLRLYKSLVRPKLEYCIQAWWSYLKEDIDNSSVQLSSSYTAVEPITTIRCWDRKQHVHSSSAGSLEAERSRGVRDQQRKRKHQTRKKSFQSIGLQCHFLVTQAVVEEGIEKEGGVL